MSAKQADLTQRILTSIKRLGDRELDAEDLLELARVESALDDLADPYVDPAPISDTYSDGCVRSSQSEAAHLAVDH